MKPLLIVVIGAVIGALDGVGIFFAPGEPYKVEIFLAAVVKGVLVAVVTALTLRVRARWTRSLAYGAVYGFGFALVVFLAKGGLKSMDAPFVVPFGIVFGALTGVLVNRYGLLKPPALGPFDAGTS